MEPNAEESVQGNATPRPAASSNARRPLFALFGSATLVVCAVLSMAGYAQPVLMGVVQGLGEFLPISSSAHLILVPWFFGWEGGIINSLTFDIALHIGTLVALIAYFWRDWLMLMQAVPGLLGWSLAYLRGDRLRHRSQPEHILSSVILATIPGAILGLLLEKAAETALRAPLLIAVTLTILGILLFVIDRGRPQAKPLATISWRDSLLIGLAQACALIPGVSRSGATITMGRLLTFDRSAAARYSFLLSAPITLAAVVLKLPDILRIPRSEYDVFLVGIVVSGAVGALAIGFLLDYIRRAGFGVFAVYRVVLAALVVLAYVLR